MNLNLVLLAYVMQQVNSISIAIFILEDVLSIRRIMHPYRFYSKDSKDTLSISTNLVKHLWFVWLFGSSVKTGTTRIISLDELYFEIHLK